MNQFREDQVISIGCLQYNRPRENGASLLVTMSVLYLHTFFLDDVERDNLFLAERETTLKG
jgi:hypothetical protein